MLHRSLSRYSDFSSFFFVIFMWCNPRANKTKANPAVFWSAIREGVMCSLRISHIEVEKKEEMMYL